MQANQIADLLPTQTEMELTLVGLQNSGKTTLVNVIAVSWSRVGSAFAMYTRSFVAAAAAALFFTRQ